MMETPHFQAGCPRTEHEDDRRSVIFATADLLDHDGPTARFLDSFNRFTLIDVNFLGSDVLAVLEEIVDPVLEGA
jgi:hypothetical protein